MEEAKEHKTLPFMRSYSQNFEDVMLRRALQDIRCGFYIDVGAFDPLMDSVTNWFYGEGWSGINIEPNPEMLATLQVARTRDVNLGCAIGQACGSTEFWVVEGTGLSSFEKPILPAALAGSVMHAINVQVLTLDAVITRHAAGRTIDFLKIDAEGAEGPILAGARLDCNRPRIVVVEAIEPITLLPNWTAWEPSLLAAGYGFVYFDGLNRFYLREEDRERTTHFSLPPGCFDSFQVADLSAQAREADLTRRLVEVLEALQAHNATLQTTQKEVEAQRARADESDRGRTIMWEATQHLQIVLADTQIAALEETRRADETAARLQTMWEATEHLRTALADTQAEVLRETQRADEASRRLQTTWEATQFLETMLRASQGEAQPK